ncbi:cytoplasmic dynein 2 intermediate chain 1-like [Ornithodoros turicata]|uniref:cytoplasmic dynein 2 intermediate chain 1-like n=1 Tax=Ornithodoros turicata TaxID=34597 RepID=UPI00313A13F3
MLATSRSSRFDVITDYESDFEDDDETTEASKVSDDVTSAHTSCENQLNRQEEPAEESKESRWKSEPSLQPPKRKNIQSSLSAYNLFNFASARKTEEKKKELSKTQQRAKDILELVALDYVSISVFDLPPSSYDAYIKAFGRANTRQEMTQTDSMCEEEAQTEDIDIIEKWTQQPPHDYRNLGCKPHSLTFRKFF